MIWYVEENFRIDELLCCFDVKVLVCKAIKMFKCCWPKKKSAWTDLDQVNFEKNLQCLNVQIEKSAWTGLDKVKKASSAASVFKISSRLATDLTLTRGAVDATPVAVAVSLTFSLVKN